MSRRNKKRERPPAEWSAEMLDLLVALRTRANGSLLIVARLLAVAQRELEARLADLREAIAELERLSQAIEAQQALRSRSKGPPN